MRRLGRILALALGGVAALLAAPGAQAQEEGEVHGIFTEQVEVRLVNVDVVVTDRAGLPVRGLERGDFRVFENGEEVEVTHFAAFTEGGRRSLGTAEADAAAEAAPAHVLVLVDDDHLSPVGRKTVLDALREELDRWMVGGAQVMVVHKTNTPRVVQRFTGDRRAVEAALARVAENGGGMGDLVSEQMLLRRLAAGAQPGDSGGRAGPPGAGSDVDFGQADAEMLLDEIRQFAAEHQSRVQQTAIKLSHLVSAMAGIPGRKAVLYVADRLPVLGGMMAMEAWSERYGGYSQTLGSLSVQDELSTYDTSPYLEQVIAEASAARVTIYPLGHTVDQGATNLSAQSQGMLTASGSQNAGSAAGQGADSLREGLWMLAAGTGGRAGTRFADTARLFEALHDDLTFYYSLGYVSPRPEDGEVRRVKVELARPGLEVRHLEKYRSKSADLRMVDAALAALLLDEGDNPVGVEIELGEPEPVKGGLEVPVTVKFPMSGLVLIPQAERHVGAVILYIVVKDEAGRMSSPTRVRVPVEIDNREMLAAMTRTAGYQTVLRMQPGRQTVAVGLRDEVGGARSVADLTVDLAPPERRTRR